MKTHAIIPIFVPHYGCPHACVFCDQKAITARDCAPDKEETIRIIEQYLSTLTTNPNVNEIEIAFFGGSFTGIPLEEQAMYLQIAKEYKDRGLVNAIHMSTRPDYINDEILDQLVKYGTDVVELGVQSFDSDVLRLSNRGHSREIVYGSCEKIKARGIRLGIQLMVGLPGDSHKKCMESVRETLKIGPEMVRIYPTVVLKNTALYRMYEMGKYKPLEEEEAVKTVSDMLREFYAAGIEVLRVGLKSSDNINNEEGSVGAGTYHPAFRQLAEAYMLRCDIEKKLGMMGFKGVGEYTDYEDKTCGGEDLGDGAGEGTVCGDGASTKKTKVTIFSSPETFSTMIGVKKSNKIYFAEKYPQISFKFAVDKEMEARKVRVTLQD